jgi:hypothetical protein
MKRTHKVTPNSRTCQGDAHELNRRGNRLYRSRFILQLQVPRKPTPTAPRVTRDLSSSRLETQLASELLTSTRNPEARATRLNE